MAYTKAHMHLVWGGSLGPSDREDAWTVGIRFASGGEGNAPGDLPPLQPDEFPSQLRADLIAAISQFHQSTGARIRRDATLEWIKYNRIGIDGRYVNTTGTLVWDVPATGGNATPTYPQQISAVTTYRTDARRGAAKTGRNYWPTGIAYDATSGGITASDRTALAGSTAALLYTLGQAMFTAGFPLVACVMSSIGSGTTRIIDRVEVGSRFDIQRRRDNSAPEIYTGQDVQLPTG